ncbi:MAG: TetR/AcrR family transcriptional regulator [Pseudomonadota bacterium]
MVAPKKHADELVLDQIRDTFWARGYAGTSISDLEGAVGLNRSSLYASYGDKRRLFEKAIDRYSETVAQKAKSLSANDNGGVALVGVLRNRASRVADHKTPEGCLMTRAFIELGAEDSDLGRKLRSIGTASVSQLKKLVAKAQSQGAVDPDLDPKQVAQLIVAVNHGMCVVKTATGSDSAPRKIADLLLSLLGLEPEAGGPKK